MESTVLVFACDTKEREAPEEKVELHAAVLETAIARGRIIDSLRTIVEFL